MDDLVEGHQDDELSLPKATVFKMIQEMLPDDIVCAKETRDLLLECCVGEFIFSAEVDHSEFIHLLASQSNEICEKTAKKTIGGEHIMQALTELGFESYLEEVRLAHGEHKQEQKVLRQRMDCNSQAREAKKSSASNFGDSGMTEEELIAQQAALFNAAREKYQQRLQEGASNPSSAYPTTDQE